MEKYTYTVDIPMTVDVVAADSTFGVGPQMETQEVKNVFIELNNHWVCLDSFRNAVGQTIGQLLAEVYNVDMDILISTREDL